jgi:hypothetical protein
MPLANIRHATTTFSIVEHPDQVKDADNLTTEDGRKLLIVKGGNSAKLVKRVLKEASVRLDRSGHPFTMSRSLRGLCHRDPYNVSVRISATQLEEYYLNEWFCYVELVHSAPPRSFNSPPLLNAGQQQYLRILDKLPSYTAALLSQSRFLTLELVNLFEVTD